MNWRWSALVAVTLLGGCARPLEGAPCPCADGWMCCAETNTCVQSKFECPASNDTYGHAGASGNDVGGLPEGGSSAGRATAGRATAGGATVGSAQPGNLGGRNPGLTGSGSGGSEQGAAGGGAAGSSMSVGGIGGGTQAGAAAGGAAGDWAIAGASAVGTTQAGGVAGTGSTAVTTDCVVLTNVAATTDLPFVRISWSPPVDKSPSHYVIERDGQAVATVDQGTTSFEDHLVADGLTAPSELEATRGTLPGLVRLSWQAPTAAASVHRYAVVALMGTGTAESCRSSGNAVGSVSTPTVIGYEFSRDDGVTWNIAGTDPTHDDAAPEPGTLVATSAATFDPTRGLVRVSVDGAPSQLLPAAAKYRVRAITSTGNGPASDPASGYAGIGAILAYQWQRSSGDGDDGYSDLHDVTGSVWVDTEAPIDSARYYRAVMTTAGAVGISQPSRVETRSVRSLSAGKSHSCAVLSDRTGACWGDNSKGQCNVPSDHFDSIAAGGTHTCALRTDKSMACWGDDSAGQASPANDSSYVFVSAGEAHTCAMRSDQQVSCWGLNHQGQTDAPRGEFWSISAGRNHTCGIRSNGDVVCWGDNTDEQAPALVPGPFQIIAAGANHSCAVDYRGDVTCWGQNAKGQAPAMTYGPFRSVCAGSEFTCGVLESGKLTCWGSNGYGQAPSDPPTDAFLTAVPGDAFDAVTCGNYHACGRGRDGRVLCWGSNSDGQAPPLPPVGKFQAIALGAEHTCAIGVGGRLACWGIPLSGAPSFPAMEAFLSLAAGEYYSCGVRADARAFCWGGIDSAGEQYPPSEDRFKSLVAAYDHSCGIRTDDTVRCWGNDTIDSAVGGQVSAVPNQTFRAISVGKTHSCGILSADATVRCWGSISNDQVPNIVPEGPFTALSTRASHNCGVTASGGIQCWGRDVGALQPPTGGAYTSAAVGLFHVCGLRTADQRVVCWGDDSLGAAPDSPAIDAFSSIAAGDWHTCGIRTDGKLLCWGNNASHQAPRPGP